MSNQKALETIGNALQEQYSRWHPKAKYKQLLDPTLDEVQKLCLSLRRSAKEERVLFHYNGHGVLKPDNGNIWVFDKQCTQYVPLSVAELQSWLGHPSVYIFDCSDASTLLNHLVDLENSEEFVSDNFSESSPLKEDLCLFATSANEVLPQSKSIPADLFTSCLTTPIKISLKWHMLKNQTLLPSLPNDIINKIPGQLNDRRTMLGELNWIFTAITDSIAWNSLPKELFLKLFRQDLLIASIFRNFLLAKRIMQYYDTTPTSYPFISSSSSHYLWSAWDAVLDFSLYQLYDISKKNLSKEDKILSNPFFIDQLAAFSLRLQVGINELYPPIQLPILLQVLMSPFHRLRGLDLLSKYLELGAIAVYQALTVGIFPYVLKLLQSNARELRPLLVSIWTRILSYDISCQVDVIKDAGHKYFLSILADPSMPMEHRTMAAFILSALMYNFSAGQQACFSGNLVPICLEQLSNKEASLSCEFKQWLIICLGLVWKSYDLVRWSANRAAANKILLDSLNSSKPQVRACALYALGTLISSPTSPHSEHSVFIDHSISRDILSMKNDGNYLVRKELICAFYNFVLVHTNRFASLVYRYIQKNEGSHFSSFDFDKYAHSTQEAPPVIDLPQSKDIFFNSNTKSSSLSIGGEFSLKKSLSISSFSGIFYDSYSIYNYVWDCILDLSLDPHPDVKFLAKEIFTFLKKRAFTSSNNPLLTFQPERELTALDGNKDLSLSCTDDATLKTNKIKDRFSNQHKEKNEYGVRYGSCPSPFLSRRKIFEKSPLMEAKSSSSIQRCLETSTPTITTSYILLAFKKFIGINTTSLLIPNQIVSDKISSKNTLRSLKRYTNDPGLKNSIKFDKSSFAKYEAVMSDTISHLCKIPSIFTCVKFLPLDPYIMAADTNNNINIIKLSGNPFSTKSFSNGLSTSFHTQPCTIEVINEREVSPLIAVSSSDGSTNVWKLNGFFDNITSKHLDPYLIASWSSLKSVFPSSQNSAITTFWNQDDATFLVAGFSNNITAWDLRQETIKLDLVLNYEKTFVRSIHNSNTSSMLVVGLSDGYVKIYDTRTSRLIGQKKCSSEPILKVLLSYPTEDTVYAVSALGEVFHWKINFPFPHLKNTFAHRISHCDFQHISQSIFSCQSNHSIGVYNIPSEKVFSTRTYDSYLSTHKHEFNSIIACHPYKPILTKTSSENTLTLHHYIKD